MNIDAIEQRSGDPPNVALDHHRRAVALPGAVPEITARTRVQGCNQHESCRKAERHGGARDRDGSVFQRLAHDFEHVARELGQFVQEEDTVIYERVRLRPTAESCHHRLSRRQK